jgi:hypothetical protein
MLSQNYSGRNATYRHHLLKNEWRQKSRAYLSVGIDDFYVSLMRAFTRINPNLAGYSCYKIMY